MSDRKRDGSSPIGTPPASKSRRKSTGNSEGRRRSSFIRGRIARQLPQLPSAEIHKDIPSNVKEEERLQKLVKIVLQHALQKLEDKNSDLENFTTFKTYVTDAVDQTIKSLETDGTFTHACHKERYLPHPINVEVEEAARQYEEYTERLQKEDVAWGQILQTGEDSMKVAVSLAEQTKEEKMKLKDVKLQKEQKKILDTKPMLNKMLKDAEKSQERTELQVDSISRMVETLNRFKDTAESYLLDHIDKIRAESFQGIEHFADPKALIADLAGTEKSKNE